MSHSPQGMRREAEASEGLGRILELTQEGWEPVGLKAGQEFHAQLAQLSGGVTRW